MGRIARHPVRILIFTFGIEYVFSWVLVHCNAIDSFTYAHQFLNKLLFSYLFAVNELLEENIKLSDVISGLRYLTIAVLLRWIQMLRASFTTSAV